MQSLSDDHHYGDVQFDGRPCVCYWMDRRYHDCDTKWRNHHPSDRNVPWPVDVVINMFRGYTHCHKLSQYLLLYHHSAPLSSLLLLLHWPMSIDMMLVSTYGVDQIWMIFYKCAGAAGGGGTIVRHGRIDRAEKQQIISKKRPQQCIDIIGAKT